MQYVLKTTKLLRNNICLRQYTFLEHTQPSFCAFVLYCTIVLHTATTPCKLNPPLWHTRTEHHTLAFSITSCLVYPALGLSTTRLYCTKCCTYQPIKESPYNLISISWYK